MKLSVNYFIKNYMQQIFNLLDGMEESFYSELGNK